MADRKKSALDKLQQSREQPVRWREDLALLADAEIATIAEHLAAKTDDQLVVSDAGKANLRRWLGRYDVYEILAAIDASFEVYLRFNENKPDIESWEVAFRKVPIFISIARAEPARPHIRQLLYIQGIIRNRERDPHLDCLWYLEHLALVGADLDEVESRAKRMSPEDFKDLYDAWLAEIGRPA